jgi:predicted small secreted protein
MFHHACLENGVQGVGQDDVALGHELVSHAAVA